MPVLASLSYCKGSETVNLNVEILSPTFVRVNWHIKLLEDHRMELEAPLSVIVIVQMYNVVSKPSPVTEPTYVETYIEGDISTGSHTLGPLQDGTVRNISIEVLLYGEFNYTTLEYTEMELYLPGEIMHTT